MDAEEMRAIMGAYSGQAIDATMTSGEIEQITGKRKAFDMAPIRVAIDPLR